MSARGGRNSGHGGQRSGGRRPGGPGNGGRRGRGQQSGRPAPGQQRPGRPQAPRPGTWTAGADAMIVKGHESSMTVAHFIYESQKGAHRLSIRALRRALASGCCRINGIIETFGNRKLRKGDIVEFNAPNKDPLDHDFESKRILYDDHGIIAYDKPPGLPVTPSDGKRTWCLERMLNEELGEVHAVHRLDAETSGIVLFARNQQTATYLKDCFREHAVEKLYIALVRGQPHKQGRKRSYLICQERRRGYERWASGRGQGAREAITTWELDRRIGRHASLMEVRPLTGRYHQIRIHFSEMGNPLLGDRLYGDRQDPIAVHRHLLHAKRVELPLPGTGERLVIQSTKLPKDFSEAIDALAKLK